MQEWGFLDCATMLWLPVFDLLALRIRRNATKYTENNMQGNANIGKF